MGYKYEGWPHDRDAVRALAERAKRRGPDGVEYLRKRAKSGSRISELAVALIDAQQLAH